MADDEPDFVETLKIILEKQGYEVIVAQDGTEALNKVKKVQPHLLLLDIMMPKLDGELVILKIKGDPKTGQIPIIVLTGLDNIHDANMCMNLGAQDYIIKPYDTEDLLEKIKKALINGVINDGNNNSH